jgi:hypothetical protein
VEEGRHGGSRGLMYGCSWAKTKGGLGRYNAWEFRHAKREEQRVRGSMAKCLLCCRSRLGFLPLLTNAEQGGHAGVPGRIRRIHGSEMRHQRGAGVA